MDSKSVKCKDRKKTCATKIQERRRASERERVSDDESATERQAGEQAAQNFAVFPRRKINQIIVPKGAYCTISAVQFFVSTNRRSVVVSNCAIMRRLAARQNQQQRRPTRAAAAAFCKCLR